MRCNTDESRDYQVGVEEGIRILKLYGYEIHSATTKSNAAKEEIKLKLALGKRSYSCLTSLPMAEVPIQAVFSHTTRYCLFSNQDKLMKIIAYNAIRCALKNGIDKDFPKILSLLGGSLTKQGQVKAANELGYVSLQLAEKIRDVDDCTLAHANICYVKRAPIAWFHTTLARSSPLVGCAGSSLIY